MHNKPSRTPAETRKPKTVAVQRSRAHADVSRADRPKPIPLAELPKISKAIAALPAEDARCLQFLMLSAGRPGEVRELQKQEIYDQSWAPQHIPALGTRVRRPLSRAASHVVQLAFGTPLAGAPGRDRVFRTAGGTEFSSHALLRKLRAIDPSLGGRSFRVTFAYWGMETRRPARAMELALGHPSEYERQIFAKFGPQSFEVALAEARSLMDDWAAFCEGQ